MSSDAHPTLQSSIDLLRCNRCRRQAAMLRTLLDPRTGQSFQMFECECGACNWQELAKDQGRPAGD